MPSKKDRIRDSWEVILLVSVKDISGTDRKLISMPMSRFLKLRKELHMRVESIRKEWSGPASEKHEYYSKIDKDYQLVGAGSESAARKAQFAAPENLESGKPRPKNPRFIPKGERTPNEQRMVDEQVAKQKETANAKRDEGGGTPESYEESDGARNLTEGETTQVSVDQDGTPGDEATGSVGALAQQDPGYDPIKEQLEQEGLEGLLKRQ